MQVWEQQWGEEIMEGQELGPSDELRMKIKGGSKITSQGEVVRNVSTGVKPVGSGSDFTVFLQHLGVAITNGGFSSTLSDPVYHYHSVFDSHPWQEKYGDPGFLRHVSLLSHRAWTSANFLLDCCRQTLRSAASAPLGCYHLAHKHDAICIGASCVP